MLETILTRIILRFANRFICDTLHTDTFSLWGGDLVVQNFELQTKEVARDALAAVGLRLVRGFVRELRVHVPWNAIRSQSLRVEVDAVEVVFAATRPTSEEQELQALPAAPQQAASTPKQISSQTSLSPQPVTPTAAAAAAPSQEGLDEANETWLQPLLRTIMGNVTVVANNLVAKLPRSGAVACLTVATLDSRPTSSRWEAGFNAVKGPQPMLYRAVSVRDITVTIDHLVPSERRWSGSSIRRAVRSWKPGARTARYAVELPVFHRVSIEVLVEFPLLPWPGPVNPPPACRLDVHLSPIRARLSYDQTQLLMRLLTSEVRQTSNQSMSGGGCDHESDSISDRASLSGPGHLNSWTSEPSTAATAALPDRSPASAVALPMDLLPEGGSAAPSREASMMDRQVSTDTLAGVEAELWQAAATGAGSEVARPSPSFDSDTAGNECNTASADLLQKDAKQTESGGMRGLLTDVFFGDDDDDLEDENEKTPMETRRSFCLAACVPLFSFSFEQLRDAEACRDDNVTRVGSGTLGAPFGLCEGSWLCTISVIGLSALAVKPPKGEDIPSEGSVEVHHVTLQIPSSSDNGPAIALAWGSPLARSPLDADEVLPTTVDSSARARAWSSAARRLLAEGTEFPHPSHRIFVDVPAVPAGSSTSGQAALRVGLLQTASLCNNSASSQGEVNVEDVSPVTPQGSINRASVQLAKVFLNIDANWLATARDALCPLMSMASASTPTHAAPRRSASTPETLVKDTSNIAVLEAVVSCAGLHVTFDTFVLEVGQTRADWRERPHGVDETLLATRLRETTVFVSSVFTHLVWQSMSTSSRMSSSRHGSLAFVRVSMISLQQRSPSDNGEAADVISQLVHVQEIVSIFAKPIESIQPNAEPGVAHLEVALARGSFTAGLCPIMSLLRSLDALVMVITGRHSWDTTGRGQDATCDSRALSLEIRGVHWAIRTEEYKEESSAESAEGHLGNALGWSGSLSTRRGEEQVAGMFSSDSEGEEVPVLEHIPQAWRAEKNVLRARQLYFFIRRLHVSFSDGPGVGCVIFAPYDLRPHTDLLDGLSRTAHEGTLSNLPCEAMFSITCQFCPVAPPSTKYCEPPALEAVMPPVEGLFGAGMLPKRRQCCIAWLNAMHAQVDPCWVDFVFVLMEVILPVNIGEQEFKAEAKQDVTQATNKDSLAPAVLCSLCGAILPLSLWLTLPNRPSACVTLPLITASEPHLQATGFCVDVFDEEITEGPAGMPSATSDELLQPVPDRALRRLQRCFALAQDDEMDPGQNSLEVEVPCVALSRVSGTAMRSESHNKGRPEVSLAAQLQLSPLQWYVRPSHLAELLGWARSFHTGARSRGGRSRSNTPMQDLQEPQEQRTPCGIKSTSLIISVSVRATASVNGIFEIQAGKYCFHLKGVAGAFRHVADANQPRTSVSLRLSRPHAVMNMPPVPSFDIVEWCEETVHGDDSIGPALHSAATGISQRRSAHWLVIHMRQRGRLPVELTISTLPLGLCLSVASLCRVVSALAAAVSDVTARVAPDSNAHASPNGFASPRANTSRASNENEKVTSPLPGSSPQKVASTRSQADHGTMCLQVSLDAVSVRLFADSPFEAGTPHLAICVAEAAGRCTLEEGLSARAVISVSLFKQPDEDLVTHEVVPAPVCVVDDFLRPCTVTFCDQLPEADRTARSKKFGAETFHVELLQRSHFCSLVLLGNRYVQSLDYLALGHKPAKSGQRVKSAAPDVASDPEQLNLVVQSVMVRLPGHQSPGNESICQLSVKDINCTSIGYGKGRHSSLQCWSLQVQCADERQLFSIAHLSVTMLSSSAPNESGKQGDLDVTVSVEGGIFVRACTGHLFGDLSCLLLTQQEQQHVAPTNADRSFAAEQDHDEQVVRSDEEVIAPSASTATADPTSVKLRLLVNGVESVLMNDSLDACSFSISILNLSVFSWPAAYILPPADSPNVCKIRNQRLDVSFEALSATADGPRMASAPLVSPLSLDGSVVTFMPVDNKCFSRARTEVRLHFSPLIVSAGAWQLRLLTNVCSFKTPRRAEEGSSEKDPDADLVTTRASAAENEVGLQNGNEEDVSTVEEEEEASKTLMDDSLASVQSRSNSTAQEHDLSRGRSELDSGSSRDQLEFDYLVLELQMGRGSGYANMAVEHDRYHDQSGCCMPTILQVPVLCSVLLEELEPWQAVKLPDELGDGCPRCAIRLDRPAHVPLVAVDWIATSTATAAPETILPEGIPLPVGFTALVPGSDFDVEAWDDAQGCFIDIDREASATAICSDLIALRLRALAEKPSFRLLVYTATPHVQNKPIVRSELFINCLIPRITWSILDSDTVCLMPSCAAVPPLEESFGIISFYSTVFSFWMAGGQGTAVRMTAMKTSVELYDMSTLSLSELVVPDDNKVEFNMRILQTDSPSLVPLQIESSRSTADCVARPVLDVDLGTWHIQLPPWTMARFASLAQSVIKAWAHDPQGAEDGTSSECLSSRLPLVIQNGLPLPLVFGQVLTSEAIPLLPGDQCGYAWKHADPTKQCLYLALDSKAPQSAPIPLGRLQVDTKIAWARLELWTMDIGLDKKASGPHAVNLCIQRVSRDQCKLIVLPSVLLFSYIPWDVEFDFLQEGSSVPCSTNRILLAAQFLQGLPVQLPCSAVATEAAIAPMHTAAEPNPSTDSKAGTLSTGKFIGALPVTSAPVWVRFRKPAQAWGPQLPLSTDFMEPYTTMVPLVDEAMGMRRNVMCKCADLWGVSRDVSVWKTSHNEPLWLGAGDSGHSPTCVELRAPEDAPLPNVLQLWPLLTVRNSCPFAISVCVSSMGAVDVPAGGCQVVDGAADPRQVTAIEFRASMGCAEVVPHVTPMAAHDAVEIFSSGPLLVKALTQFAHEEADETVSWCNSIRCKSVWSTATELLLLVELRRCKLSGVIRSVLVEPMWTFHNETGEDVLISAANSQVVQHVANPGRSISTVLGAVQNDPSFPFVAKFGFRSSSDSQTVAWSESTHRCSMGQTTRVEMHQGPICFVVLVSVSARWTIPGSISQKTPGGVHVRLYAAAYIRSKVDVGLRVAVGTTDATEVHVPPSSQEQILIPWSRWPSSDAALIREIRKPPEKDADDGPQTVVDLTWSEHFLTDTTTTARKQAIIMRFRLEDEACTSNSWSRDVPLGLSHEKGVNPADAVVTELAELLAPEHAGSRLCGGHVHDVQLDAVSGKQASILLNVAFHVHAQGCFVLTLLRCLQPPLLCANFTEYTAWVASPWRDLPESSEGQRHCVPPGAMLEVACPLLRSMEVFPSNGGTVSHDAVPPKSGALEQDDRSKNSLVRTSLWLDPDVHVSDPLEIVLTADADISWPLPEARNLSVVVRYASGVCRVELRMPDCNSALRLALPPPRSTCALPLMTDICVRVADLVVHLCARGSAAGQKPGRHLAFHAHGLRAHLRMEGESSAAGLGRAAASRQLVEFHSDLLSLADVSRPSPAAPLKQVFACPMLDLEVKLFHPPYGLPISYELARASLRQADGEQSIVMVCLDDSFIEAVQFLVAEITTEFTMDADQGSGVGEASRRRTTSASSSAAAKTLPPIATKEFQYIFLNEFVLSPVPLYVDLQLSKPVFVSFTGLTITFPEIHLIDVATTSFALGRELLAHCVAFLLLKSPLLLGSCDLLGNPVQAYRHVRDGLSDLFHRPLREGFRSLARHLSSASLTSVSAVSDSIRRNLPAAPPSPVSHGEGGLGVGLRALAGGVGRGLSGIVYWEQHTPNRQGALGRLRGARNALTGAVAEPVGGLLDLVTSTARGWAAPEASVAPSGPHAVDCQACLGCWPLRPELDVSPYKFHLQCCQGLPPPGSLPALLFWSPRCELVRVDGVGGAGGHAGGEPSLRLIRAGLLLTTTQLCVLVDEDTARVLDIGAVQAVEEARGRPFSLVTIASTAGIIWQLHVRGEPGEFVAHLRRARRLAGVPPGAV